MSWTWIDWAFVIILGFSVLSGFARGFIREGLGLAAWIAALIAARTLAAPAAGLFADYIDSQQIRLVIGFMLVVFVTLLLANIVIRLLHAMIEWVGMGFFNRLLGAGFGLLRGGLVLIMIVAVLGLTPLSQSDDWQQSVFLPWIEQGRDLAIRQYQQLDQDQNLMDEASQRARELQQHLPGQLRQ
ncbi:membrane protein required for colicin V production [Kushneria avicenniae]|uniref:Membrane protein required for colicin V production n=1 Tax=Kushneria avicenniae TaxID=402385 RepID=A0A1I1GDT9_9GAMM|nr:CvpA family protein [Kushneria avicenniae]SFC08028.1 membrane protein required for colicin V production [Kushneria avicenniae]